MPSRQAKGCWVTGWRGWATRKTRSGSWAASSSIATKKRMWFIIALAEGQEWLSPLGKPGDLVLADLTSIPISGDRTIWVPGTWFQGFASPDCDSPDDGTGQVQASDEALDFTVSISVPQVGHIARQADRRAQRHA